MCASLTLYLSIYLPPSALVLADLLEQRETQIIGNILREGARGQFICQICHFGASSRHKVFCHIGKLEKQYRHLLYSVADPNPESRTLCLFYPWFRDPE